MMSVTLTGQWEGIRRALDPAAFRRRIESEVGRANDRIGREGVAVVRRGIRAGSYAPNAATTAFLKASSQPLVNTGELFQSISYAKDGWNVVKIGLIRATAGDKQTNIGIALHEGFTLHVTDAVRAKFMSMLRAAAGAAHPGRDSAGRFRRRGKLPPMSGSARSVWIIPARPYLETPLSSQGFQQFVFNEWRDASRRAIFGR